MQVDVRDVGSIPRSGRSPGGWHGNLLQYSCLENSMDRGAWTATVHRVAESRTWLKQLSTHARTYFIYNHFLLCKIYFAYYIRIYMKVYVWTHVFICTLHGHIPCMYTRGLYIHMCVLCVSICVTCVWAYVFMCMLGIYEYMCLLSCVYESECTGTHACILTYTPKSSRWQWLAETVYSLNKEYLSWNWKNEQSWHKKAVFKWEQKTHTWYDQTENSVQLEWPQTKEKLEQKKVLEILSAVKAPQPWEPRAHAVGDIQQEIQGMGPWELGRAGWW